DERGTNFAIMAQDILRRPCRPFSAEQRLEARGHVGDEGFGTTGLHLEQKRLALMDGHAARTTNGLVAPLGGQTTLVKRMTRLVNDSHEAFDKIILIIARGDAAIVGHTAGKGMVRDI